MNSDRLQQLRKFAEDEPGDPFNWYALALEYMHSDPGQAMMLLDKLLAEFEDYLPAYYIAATHKVDQGHINTAADILRKGIKLARRQKDSRTASELGSVLDDILFE